MNVVEAMMGREGWLEMPSQVPLDSHVLVIDADWNVTLGRIPRLAIVLNSGHYKVVWDEAWSLNDLIKQKRKIEAKHGTGDTYRFTRARRTPPGHLGGYQPVGSRRERAD